MKLLGTLANLLIALIVPALAASEVPPWEPVQGTSAWFAPMHQRHQAEAAKGGWEIVCFGDSHTQFWERHPDLWQQATLGKKALNLGIGGDRTQEMLWRIDDGLFANVTPEVIVVMAGANNWRNRPEDTARGVATVVDRLRTACPQSRILILAQLPSQPQPTAYRQHVARINALTAALADPERGVFYLDFGASLLEADGSLTPEVSYDGLHLAAEGYRRWATAMRPTLARILEP